MKQTTRQLAVLGASFLALNASIAASADLADVPLANAPTSEILPNIAFILDDSGSMNEECMPEYTCGSSNSYCYKWHRYNSAFYNPGTTYLPPIKADGSRYANASFSAARNDGYFELNENTYNNNPNGTTNLESLSSSGSRQSNATFPDFSRRHTVTSVTVTINGGAPLQLLNATPIPNATGTTDEDSLGQAVAASINARTATTGFQASYSNQSNILTIFTTTVTGTLTTPLITTNKTQSGGQTQTVTAGSFSTVYSNAYYTTHATNPNSTTCDANSSYTVVGSASEIQAPGVTTGSAEAKQNYANWFSYYRKRAYLAKAAAGEAFAALEQNKYRVGLFYINSIQSGAGSVNNDLPIADFTGTTSGTHRHTWFTRLYGTRQDYGTPLREALTRAGRMFAGKLPNSDIGGQTVTWDPVQFSCQRNFTILTTDGYWNTLGPGTATYGSLTGNSDIGDKDGATTGSRPDYDTGPYPSSSAKVSRPSWDNGHYSNTLADVAYYYYHTDLRTTGLNNCSGVPDRNNVTHDVCNNDVPPAGTSPSNINDVAPHQHMTTFTIGLGVDGTLTYQEGYKSSTSGSYYNITQGTANWPDPYADDAEKIDDLWHAAVNGRGTYFSARNAESFSSSIREALGSIQATTGSGAAAATSNLQPTTGDNFIYIANYRTVNWDGELTAKTIDLSTGAISSANSWTVSNQLAGQIVADGGGLAGNADTRVIKTWSASGTNKVKDFLWSQLDSATEQPYFSTATVSVNGNSTTVAGALASLNSWGSAEVSAHTGEKLVNFLRGQDRNEDQDRLSGYGTYSRLYRDREKILGDIVHSQPIYVKAPFYEYLDAGYTSFKLSNSNRDGSVYVAANDGMLHAFNSETGAERWAYVPPMQLKEMWRLADKNYASNHRFYLDGPISVSDIYDGTNWKTILVGAMGKGGRGIYALDITTPSTPKALWNFNYDPTTNPNLGYTYGAPIITKLADGTWVVVIASGYNNVSSGDGKGYVFVLNANTGALIKTLQTNEGDETTPSGLTHLNIKVNDFQKDNTAVVAYGGDLLGNLYRFNLDAAGGTVATKVTALGSSKPISVPIEIGEIDGRTALFFGTGRYLGEDDLTSTTVQSFYAIKDDGSTTVNAASVGSGGQLVQQTVDTTNTRGVTGSVPDWGASYGWFLNLPVTGERVHLPAQLYFGTVLFASVVPTATECQPGGYSVLYALDYASGLRVTGATENAWIYGSPLVGVTVARLPGGTTKIYGITADGGYPTGSPPTLPIKTGSSGSDSGMRIMWREILN